jgi:hypothetical protein
MVDFYQSVADADEYNVRLVKNWSAENNDTEYDPHYHNDVKQYLRTGKTLIFSPEIVAFFFFRHDKAKLAN